jgi:intracellular multiplication protein IcmP
MSKQGPKPAGEEPADPMWLAVVAALVVILFYAMWVAAHTPIARAYGWIREGQFGLFILGRTVWGAGLGALLLPMAFALRLKKEYSLYAKWPAILGTYLVSQFLVTRVTLSMWGGSVGVLVWLVAFMLGRMGILRRYTSGVMAVGLLLAVGGALGGLFGSWLGFFLESDPAYVEWHHIMMSSLVANGFTLIAINIPLCLFVMRRSLSTNPTNHKFFGKTRDYTLHTFTDEQAKHYPHLKLFRKLDLTKRSIHEGKYRMADTEKGFAIKHKLLDRIGEGDDFKVNRDRAAEVFRKQVGRPWRSPKELTPWEAMVLAVLLPRIAALDPAMSELDYKEALSTTDRLLSQAWIEAGDSYDAETDRIRLDLNPAIRTLRKYWKHKAVQPYFKRHAFVYTLIYAMLNDARKLGVLPANEFRWLRVADRRLWILIDNVGRNVAFTEISGAYSHYLHEMKRGRALERFAIDGAVTGLIEGVESYKFTEEELEVINKQLADAEKKAVVDPKAVAVNKQTYILAALRVETPQVTDVIDVCILNEKGALIYRQQSKPLASVEDIQDQHGLSDEEMAKVVSAPPSITVAKKVLEVVNGHDLIVFYGGESALYPGIERSAASIRVLQDPDAPSDLLNAAALEEVSAPSKLASAEVAAGVVRSLWLKVREAEMRAEAAAAAKAAGGGG